MRAKKLAVAALGLGLIPAVAVAQSEPSKETAPDRYEHATDASGVPLTDSSMGDASARERTQELSALRRDIEDAKTSVSSGGKEKLDELKQRVDKLEEKGRSESGAMSADFRKELTDIREDLREIKPATGHEHPEDRRNP